MAKSNPQQYSAKYEQYSQEGLKKFLNQQVKVAYSKDRNVQVHHGKLFAIDSVFIYLEGLTDAMIPIADICKISIPDRRESNLNQYDTN